jgi:hypothetical protein
MITNNSITYYHKTLNDITHLEEWNRILFSDVWAFGGKGSSINKGYENANYINVRIPMKYVNDTSIFQIGDIISIGEQGNISKQSDLNGTEFYNVTSININNFGNNPHIHLGGK